MKHAENPILCSVRQGGVGGIEAGDLSCEAEHIAGLNTVTDGGDALRRDHETWALVQGALHRRDLRIHPGI
jgi:hypothetical protein